MHASKSSTRSSHARRKSACASSRCPLISSWMPSEHSLMTGLFGSILPCLRWAELVEPVENDAQLSRRGRIGVHHDEAPARAWRPVAVLREIERAAEQQLRRSEGAREVERMVRHRHDARARPIEQLATI